jgi:hypothetical protein
LGGGGEEELVLGTIRAPQAQAVQLQDTLEVGVIRQGWMTPELPRA